MALLAEFSVTASPDRRLVEVYDADAYLGDEEAMGAAEVQVVAGNGYHLYLLSLQPDIDVRITVRVWDTPPKPPADAEGHVPVNIESATGTLVFGQLTLGPAGEMTLPRPGVYEGYAWWAGRAAASAYYDETLSNIDDDWPPEQIRQAWNRCPVDERYVLDLSFVRDPSPDDEDDADDE
ncbi:hypothetical protein QQY24_18140 [Streptomyces sp. TG1A-8]|uniref:hypothetical protein n=1 Tax=Streptomyces sp. TG1A-8 TaxID=3051385 RepID=UPI00265C6D23|nr:hypothetical protein [Streptomyces sp. TG1A-8]MDO0927241.1 hypothetical protein [Streptomyces sp. TG1A-8]